jgi:hypothetical protein
LDTVVPGVPKAVADAIERAQHPNVTEHAPADRFAAALRNALAQDVLPRDTGPVATTAPVLVRRTRAAPTDHDDLRAPQPTAPVDSPPARAPAPEPGTETSRRRWAVAGPVAVLLLLVPLLVAVLLRPTSDSPPPIDDAAAAGPGTSTSSSTTPSVVRADVTGDGSEDTLVIRGHEIEVRFADEEHVRHYAVDETDGAVLVGDWNCDGRSTLALHDERTGRLLVYEDWPRADQPLPATSVRRVEGLTSADVRRTQTCDTTE